MIGAKAMDPVLGVDIHIIQPPGPVPPLPVPHPFVGMLIDPMDFAPVIGATVMINGMPRATAGTGGQCVPPHIPIGGVFVKPPANECEVFMGSATVLADGDPLGRLGSPALSCHCVGMPPPPRLKKKRKPKSLTLPTSVVLAVPAGAPVLVGGPPTISMMALGMKAAMAGLGKAFKKLRKLQKASRRMKGVSKKVHAAAQKAMTKLGVPPSVQNKVHRAVCTVTGHPVDVATGKMYTEAVDFEVEGPLPFIWERVWYSCSVYDGPLGHGWHHAYDLALLEEDGAVALRMADGRAVAFPAPGAEEVEVNEQEGLSLRRDGEGYVVRDRAGLDYRFARDGRHAAHALRSVTGTKGAEIRFHYDASGLLTHAIDSTGRPIVFVHDERGRITEIHAPRPDAPTLAQVAVRYLYDDQGELITAVDALEGAFHYTYRGHLMIQETDRRGYSFHFRYDGETTGARCTATWGEDGLLAVELAYSTTFTTVTFSDGGVWRYCYDHQGLVTDRIDPFGGRWRFSHDSAGRVVEETDPTGSARCFEYDEWGSPAGSINAAGHRTPSPSDDEEEEDGLAFDPNAYELPSDPARWEFGSLLESVGSEDGDAWLLQQLPPRLRSALALAEATADDTGPVEEFDRMGRLVRRRFADGSYEALAYDAEGNVIAWKDRDGAISRFRYGSRNLLQAEIDPLGGVTEYEHSPTLEVTRTIDPIGTVHDFEHDLRDRHTGVRTAGNRTDLYLYDAADNLVEHRDGGGALLVRYEVARGGVDARRILAGGAEHAFRYDGAGRLVSAAWDDHLLNLAYHVDGTPIEDGRDGVRVRHSIGTDGRLRRTECFNRYRTEYTTSPNNPAVVRITDPTGAIQSVAVGADGLLLKILADGARELVRYDRDGACLEKHVWRPGAPADDRRVRYGYSPAGDLRSVEHAVHGAVRYAYDGAHRLQREERPHEPPREYSFDAAGNLLGKPGLSGVVLGPGNRVVAANGAVLRYDERGRLTGLAGSGEERAFQYDALDRLVRVDVNGDTWEAEYDPLGRRVAKTWRGCRTEYWWDDFRLAAERSSSGVLRIYVYVDLAALVPFMFVEYPDRVTKAAAGKRYYIFTDQIGTPLRVEDAAGAAVWSADVSPFGEARVAAGALVEMPLRFPGHYFDPETGLHYNRFRYYSPELGRYLQPDPLGFENSVNVYAYPANPLTVVDLDGLAYRGGKAKARRPKARSRTGVKRKTKPTARTKVKPKKKPRRPSRPNEAKWKKKGGKVTHHKDGRITYTNRKGVSVTYDKKGYPDFRPHAKDPPGPVTIDPMKGDHYHDYKAANKKAGIPGAKPPKGYRWHHCEDGKTMVLVPKNIHGPFSHSGGVSKIKNA